MAIILFIAIFLGQYCISSNEISYCDRPIRVFICNSVLDICVCVCVHHIYMYFFFYSPASTNDCSRPWYQRHLEKRQVLRLLELICCCFFSSRNMALSWMHCMSSPSCRRPIALCLCVHSLPPSCSGATASILHSGSFCRR